MEFVTIVALLRGVISAERLPVYRGQRQYTADDRRCLRISAQSGAKFPWHRYRSFIDIGCAEGALPVQVARAHQHLAVRFRSAPGRRDALPTARLIVYDNIIDDERRENAFGC